jgi:hypothetical protein
VRRLILLSCLFAAAAQADGPFDLSLDLRLVATDDRASFLHGGLGKLRFDGDHEGLQLGRLRMAWEQPIGEIAHLHLDASMWDAGDNDAIDLTEAYLTLRPYPRAGWQSRVKLGAFYAPISLEHRAAGWTNPYLLDSSAINTWVGEELRTIGAEYSLDWLGTRLGHDLNAGLVAGVYGYNDPAGTRIAAHGWSAHDRQTMLFSRVGEPRPGTVDGSVLFAEMDDRAGYYVGAHLQYLDRAELQFLHYDNRADPAVYDADIRDFAWLTRFDGVGLRTETARDWTFIAQWLAGKTYAGPDRYEWAFESGFALVSKAFGRHRLSARADYFEVDRDPLPWLPEAGGETGNILTIGYRFERDDRWSFAIEALQVRSDVSDREYLGEPTQATESQVQASVQYRWSGPR